MKFSKRMIISISVALAVLCALIPLLVYFLSEPARAPKIIVIGKTSTMDVEFWRSLHDGMDSAKEELGADYEFRSMPNESDVEGQKSLLEKAVAENPDAIVWIAADYEMAEQAKLLADSKVKFLMLDSDVDYTGKYKQAFVGTDNYGAGVVAGEMAGSGKFGRKAAVVVHAEFSRTGASRLGGIRDGFGSAGNEILGVYSADNSSETARTETLRLLDEHPDLEILFATNEVATLGVIEAVAERNLEKKINIFAFDCSKKQIQSLEDGTLSAIVAQYPFRMGYRAIESAFQIARGRKVNPFVDTGMMLINFDNLYDKTTQEILFPFK